MSLTKMWHKLSFPIVDSLFKSNKFLVLHIDNNTIFNILLANIKKGCKIEKLTQVSLDNEELIKFVKDNKLKNLPAYLVIGGKQIISRVISMPEIPDSEIKQALRFEITKYIPIPCEELIFDYQVLERFTGPSGPQIRIMVVATRINYVEGYCDLVAKAGLKPKKVEVEGLVLRNLYLNLVKENQENNACCIYLDYKQGVFSFIVKGKVFFIHNAEWEQSIVNRLSSEFQRVNNYLQKQLQIEPIEKIHLFGAEGTEENALALANELNIEVAVGSWKLDAFMLPEGVKDINALYSFALGVFLQEVQ